MSEIIITFWKGHCYFIRDIADCFLSILGFLVCQKCLFQFCTLFCFLWFIYHFSFNCILFTQTLNQWLILLSQTWLWLWLNLLLNNLMSWLPFLDFLASFFEIIIDLFDFRVITEFAFLILFWNQIAYIIIRRWQGPRGRARWRPVF